MTTKVSPKKSQKRSLQGMGRACLLDGRIAILCTMFHSQKQNKKYLYRRQIENKAYKLKRKEGKRRKVDQVE